MPATVTTPVNNTVDSSYTLTPIVVASITVIYPSGPTTYPVNTGGIVHLQLQSPLRRWNGTAWVAQYLPRF